MDDENVKAENLRFDNCKDDETIPEELSEGDWEEVNDYFLSPKYD